MADTSLPDPNKVFMVSDFSAGMNRLMDATKIGAGEYPILVNGRTRFNSIRPIRKALEITGLPPGKIQGLYAAVDWMIVFVDGLAFYRNYAIAGSLFIQVNGFKLDSNVEIIYAELVPQSLAGGIRKAVDVDAMKGVTLTGLVAGNASPTSIVCQDGINQPQLISSAGFVRTLQNIDQWISPNQREYVPVGKQMMYYSGVLYIVSPDGSMIYRSVTGRPLDFVIAIDTNGDKLADDGSTADKLAITVDYAPITAIRALSTFDGSFFVSTSRQSYQIAPITDGSVSSIYGEPQFRHMPLFPTGALNQFSVVDLLGDTGIIDYAGVRTFNAVMQLRNAGKNSPFSAKVQALFTKHDNEIIVQTQTCCVEFDNYAYFALNTVYGPALVIYDCVNQCWSGLDIYAGVGTITFMAVVQTVLTRKLLFVAKSGDSYKIYEAFGDSENFEQCGAYIGEFCSGDSRSELKPDRLRLVFSDVFEDGVVYAQTFTDRVPGTKFSEVVQNKNAIPVYPIALPFGDTPQDTEKNASFDLGRESIGWKHGFMITWDFNATLSRVGFEAKAITQQNNLEQTAANEIAISAGLPYIYSYAPLIAIPTQIIRITGRGLLKVLAVKLNSTYLGSFVSQGDTGLEFTVPDGTIPGTYTIKLVTANTEVEAEDDLTITV